MYLMSWFQAFWVQMGSITTKENDCTTF